METHVVEVRSVGPHTVAIEFETPPGFDAEPGQFVRLSGEAAGEEHARFYTLSSPTVGERFEVTVEADPDESGPFSEHLAALEPGDALDMEGPFGSQYYEGERRAVVLAGGPGVGPAVAVAERALDEGGEAAVCYRTEGAPVHAERLDRLRERGARVQVLSADEQLDPAVADLLTGTADERVFVYGFDAFVDAARSALVAAGGDPAAAKVENFG